jgi:endonuclease/exonuclease/phosphatase family metal-dependent hydrolase
MAELSVACLNLHWGVDMRGRPYDALAACVALDADVLVLPEAWRPHGRRAFIDELVDTLGGTLHEVAFMSDRNPARPRHLDPPTGRSGTCGLAVISRLPVRSFTAVPLPRAQGDVIEQRHAIIARVAPADGVEVAVAGIHASHRLWGSLPQLRVVDRALVATGLPSVIVGDCNMWGPPIQLVLRDRRRAVRGRTWPAGRPHSQIDHVWIDDAFTVADAQIGAAVGSDHRPVRAALRLR